VKIKNILEKLKARVEMDSFKEFEIIPDVIEHLPREILQVQNAD
jgi:hypothetical protein